MRRIAFPLFGAVLFGTAAFFGGLIQFKNGWSGITMQELAIWLIVVGTTTGVFVGILLERGTALSVKRRTRFILLGILGAVCGLVAGFVYAVNLDEVCVGGGIDFDSCGWPFLGWVLTWRISLGLWAAIGGTLGIFPGFAAPWLTRERRVPLSALAES